MGCKVQLCCKYNCNSGQAWAASVEWVQVIADGTGYRRLCRSSECTNVLVEDVSISRNKISEEQYRSGTLNKSSR